MSKKRQGILETSERLFYMNGFHAVGIKRIISESNVSLMTLYNHFESKEALILEVLKQREQAYFSYLKENIDMSVKEQKKDFAFIIARAHMQWLELNGSNGCLFLRAKEEYMQENKEITTFVLAHKQRVMTFFQEYALSERESLRLAIQFEGATALVETTNINCVKEEFLSSVSILFQA